MPPPRGGGLSGETAGYAAVAHRHYGSLYGATAQHSKNMTGYKPKEKLDHENIKPHETP
jgi:hypothetical protein